MKQDDRPEFHRLTGEVVRTWADLENGVSTLVGALLRVDQFRARIVIASIPGSRAQREFVVRLAETYLDPALLPQFRRLVNRMKSLGHSRNLLAHAPMHINVDGTLNKFLRDVFSDAMDGGWDFESKAFPLNDLRSLVDALQRLYLDFMLFSSECTSRIHSLSRKHREQQSHPSP